MWSSASNTRSKASNRVSKFRADRRNFVVACLVLALAPILQSHAQAQQTFVTGTVYRPNGKPAIGVSVHLERTGTKLSFRTGGDGRYFIGYVKPGNYKISVNRNRTEIFLRLISLPANERYDIKLN